MAKGKPAAPAPTKPTNTRNNGKAPKKNPKFFDKILRKLVKKKG